MPSTPKEGVEYSIECPYHCGTVLKGVHAVGNLTRHLKSDACKGSGKRKRRYACPKGCPKEYTRSDGCKLCCDKLISFNVGPEVAQPHACLSLYWCKHDGRAVGS
jgi:hypothetical protein